MKLCLNRRKRERVHVILVKFLGDFNSLFFSLLMVLIQLGGFNGCMVCSNGSYIYNVHTEGDRSVSKFSRVCGFYCFKQ